MERLTDEFLASCRRDNGRILRGENMTRIETFVDAAFAFSFTMLVISIDQIPRSPTELLELSRDIPAFVLSSVIIGSIWLAHTRWSRTFGLQDSMTVLLSLGLVVLVLIFVYPIKLMVQATVAFLSDGALGIELFDDPGWANNGVASLFVYFSLGLMALSFLIVSLYWNAYRHRRELVLSAFELHYCKLSCVRWLVVAATALLSCLIALSASIENVPFAGYIYTSMFISINAAEAIYIKQHPVPEAT